MRSLERLGVDASELKAAMGNIADKGARDAKSLAPVGPTGRLVNSIRGNKAKGKAVVKAGTKAVNYASFHEFGTSKNTAREYVTKAVEGNRSYAVQQIERELRQIIARNNLK